MASDASSARAPSPAQGPGRATVLTATILHGWVHVVMLLFAGVQELMAQELGRGHGAMGLLGFASYLAFGLGAPLAGWLADHYGPRRILELTAAGMAATCTLVALAPDVALLGPGLFLLGLTASLYHPAGLGLLSTSARRGRAFAIHGVGGSLGLAAAPALAGSIAVMAGGSWRAPYWAGALGSLALLAALRRWVPAGGGRRAAAAGAAAEERSRPMALAVALVMMTALGLCYRGSLTFLPEVLGQGLAPKIPGASAVAIGGWVATLALLLGVAGQWVGGGILFHRFRLEALFGTLLVPCLVGLLVMGRLDGWWLALGAGLFGFFFFAAQPVGNGLVARFTSEARRSTGYGIHFLLTFGVGSAGAWIAGASIERWGPGSAFLSMLVPGGLAVLLAAVLVALPRRRLSPEPTGGYPS